MGTVDAPSEHQPTPQLEEHAADPFPERVLLATDGGQAGDGALRWVAHRSKMHRVDVEVMTVVEVDWLHASLSVDQSRGRTTSATPDVKQQLLADVRTHATEQAEQVKRHLAGVAPSDEVRVSVQEGEPRDAFLAASAEADLIVVGSNRSGALAGLLGPTFSVKLVEAAQCPAIVVPRDWEPTHGPVVVGMEGDASDQSASLFALHEARVLHRPLRVVHAWSLPVIINAGSAREEAVGLHSAALEHRIAELRTANPDLTIQGVLVEGDASEALAAEAEGAEMLVVGTHDKDWADRFFVGSVSREVVSKPPCVVAVVRPHR